MSSSRFLCGPFTFMSFVFRSVLFNFMGHGFNILLPTIRSSEQDFFPVCLTYVESLEICQLLRSQQVWQLTQHDFRSKLKHPGVEHSHRELCWGRWTSGSPCVEQTHWCCPDLSIWSTLIINFRKTLVSQKRLHFAHFAFSTKSRVWDWFWLRLCRKSSWVRRD